MKKVKINGEAGDVRGETVHSWMERLPELLQGYSSRDIWNLDETACFWKALPDHGFGKKDHSAKVAKKPSRGLPLPFWLTQMERRKLRLSFGNRKIQDVLKEWTRQGYQCNILVSQKGG